MDEYSPNSLVDSPTGGQVPPMRELNRAVRQSPASKDMHPEAEESMTLKAVTKQRPMKREQNEKT
jgi:hypothetical protein